MNDYNALSPEYKQLVNELAELEHLQWAGWVSYMFDNYTPKNIERWKRQMNTRYEKLSDNEKLSDIHWALQVLRIITNEMPLCRLCGHDPSNSQVKENNDNKSGVK